MCNKKAKSTRLLPWLLAFPRPLPNTACAFFITTPTHVPHLEIQYPPTSLGPRSTHVHDPPPASPAPAGPCHARKAAGGAAEGILGACGSPHFGIAGIRVLGAGRLVARPAHPVEENLHRAHPTPPCPTVAATCWISSLTTPPLLPTTRPIRTGRFLGGRDLLCFSHRPGRSEAAAVRSSSTQVRLSTKPLPCARPS